MVLECRCFHKTRWRLTCKLVLVEGGSKVLPTTVIVSKPRLYDSDNIEWCIYFCKWICVHVSIYHPIDLISMQVVSTGT